MKKATCLLAALFFAVFAGIMPVAAAAAGNGISISAKSAILMTLDGSILYEKNADNPMPIASTTKIMTAFIALQSGNLDDYFTVDENAIKVEGTSMGLQAGDLVTMRTLCYGMLLSSGNDAANAAAVRIAGSVEAFVERMNQLAKKLGMTHTKFATPSGLDANVEHYSTAHDMAVLTSAALKNEDFAAICASKSAQVSYGNPPYNRTLRNHNRLLREYAGAIGVKTGFTKKAGRCLVAAAKRNMATLISVVLQAPSDWNDSRILLDYGFSTAKAYPLDVDFSSIKGEVFGGNASFFLFLPETHPTVTLNEADFLKIKREVEIRPYYTAPISQGEVVGKAVYKLNGKEIRSVLLRADCSIDKTDTFVRKREGEIHPYLHTFFFLVYYFFGRRSF